MLPSARSHGCSTADTFEVGKSCIGTKMVRLTSRKMRWHGKVTRVNVFLTTIGIKPGNHEHLKLCTQLV